MARKKKKAVKVKPFGVQFLTKLSDDEKGKNFTTTGISPNKDKDNS